MSKFRQASKYRHTQGSVMKRELWYPDLKPSSSSDFNTINASANWIAVASATTGSVVLLQLTEVGKRQSNSLPTISAHGADVTDMSFSPFDDNLLATSSDDAAVKLWTIPNNTKDNISNATAVLSGHKRRVDSIQFNPTTNVLASASSDKTVKLWDVEKGAEILTLEEHGDGLSLQVLDLHSEGVSNVAWNWNGSLLATTSKDKKLRVFDPRQKQVVQAGESHQGVKASTLVWVGTQFSSTQQIVTAGFSKFRDRQIAFWDSTNLAKPLTMSSLDNSTGIMDLLYDSDTNILFLCGKGDGGIRLYEINDSATSPYHTELTAIQSDQTQKSTARIPKRACDLMGAEIDRVLKLTANAIVPVTFVVPRKSKSEFQEDLFPPTASTEQAVSVSEWTGGETRAPKTIQLKPSSTPWWTQQETSTQSNSSSASNSNDNSASSTPQSSAPSTPSSSTSSTPSTRDSKTAAKVEPYTPRASVQVVRQSKFRHIEGKGTKTEQCYVNLQTNTGAANNSFIKANLTFFALPWRGPGGQVAVIPLTKLGRQNEKTPTVECGSECLDFDFNPFNDNLLATVTESAHLQLWKVPVGGYNLGTVTRNPDSVMKGHTRRVTSVDFHPNVENIVVTSAGDLSVRIWDISAEKEVMKFMDLHTDVVQSVTFNWDSSLFATSCKDKFLRIFDPRTNKLVEQVETHEGAKGFKATYMGSKERICTVGANKSSVRQLSVWDVRNLKSAFGSSDIDQGAGVITPVYDIDTGVVFLTGKGDGNLKMYEINDEAPFVHYLTEYRSNVPAVGTAVLPKTMCNVKDCEIMRFIKLCGDYAEPLYFRVPRTRMEYFQDDLYPPTRRPDQPVLTNKEWLAGTYRAPTLISLKPEGMTPLSEATIEKKEKKYDFNEERQKKDSEFNKDKFLASYYSQLGTQREEDNKVLKQDLQEGVDPSEWD